MTPFRLLTSLIFINLTSLIAGEVLSCIQRETTYGNVCVCNSTYCDTIPAVLNLTSGEYQWYSTSADQLGFSSTSGNFTNPSSTSTNATITVPQLNLTRQTIVGFGGAFTDATGINVLSLSEDSQTNWLKAYFGEEGIQYSVGRVPIGTTDFSVREYSYCDDEDETLESFSLQSEDLLYKIPLIQNATQLRGNGSLNLFASAWTAPTWMKTTKTYSGWTSVQDEYLDLWAQYYLKFFDAYLENNITFWGVTTQNQPLKSYFGSDIPNNGFNSIKMRKWIKESLGPAIRNSSYSELNIILHDDDRSLLPNLQWAVLSDEEVVEYADGVGFHWYSDYMVVPGYFTILNNTKELFRIGTEAANGWTYNFGLEESAVELGSWTRAERYIANIIEDLSHNFVAWVDWNMALNATGGAVASSGDYTNGPGLDSPIIVNATSDEFYKQPMFYAIGHFSKFVIPGSQRIYSTTDGDDISSLAFLRPDGKVALVIENKSSSSQTVTLEILEETEILTISAQSINTILYSV